MSYLTEKTWIPVSLVGAIIVVAVTTTAWLVNTVNEAERKNTERWVEMQKQLEKQNNAIETLANTVANSWTVALQSEFSLRFANANPQINVPDPRDLTKILK